MVGVEKTFALLALLLLLDVVALGFVLLEIS